MKLKHIRPVGRFTNPDGSKTVNIKQGKDSKSCDILFYLKSGKRVLVSQAEFWGKWKECTHVSKTPAIQTIPKIWTRLENNEKLPIKMLDWIRKRQVQRGDGLIIEAYYRGSFENPIDFIAVTDDGSYYKVNCKYIVWTGENKSIARWSRASLKECLDAIFQGREIPHDPDYET